MTVTQQAGEVMARACPGIAAIACPGGVAVEGGWVRHVFSGKAADLVGAILPRLDGTRPASVLAAELGRNPAAVAAVIGHLVHIGAAEPAEPAEHGNTVNYAGTSDADRLIRRIARSGGLVAKAAESVARLASARVSVLATPDAGNMLCSALLEAGIGDVRLGGPAEADDLLVIVGEGQATARLASLDALRARQCRPWLLVTVGEDRIQLGPLFDRRYTPCYDCAARSLTPDGVGGDAVTPGVGAIAMALAAETAVCFLGGLAPVKSVGAAISLDLSTWSSSSRKLTRRAGCESCSPVTGEPPGDDPFCYRYDQLVEPDPPVIVQQHAAIEQKFTELLRDRKVAPPTRPLVLPEAGRPNEGRVDALTLGWVLRRAAGRLDSPPPGSLAPVPPGLAPTAGNLRSVCAYVVCRGVADVAGGCYFYDPFAHELRATGTAVAVSDDLAAEPWTAVVIMTAALSRLRAKYNDFALKLAYLDAGCAMTQLELACAAAGLSCHGSLSFDAAYLSGLIGADPQTEPVTGLAFVSVKGNPADG